jgi:hypothetical protein
VLCARRGRETAGSFEQGGCGEVVPRGYSRRRRSEQTDGGIARTTKEGKEVVNRSGLNRRAVMELQTVKHGEIDGAVLLLLLLLLLLL